MVNRLILIVLSLIGLLQVGISCTRTSSPYPGIVPYNPWNEAVWKTHVILNHNPDLVEHLISYSEQTKIIRDKFKWAKHLRIIRDVIARLDNIRIPGYGDSVWGFLVDLLDFAIPKGKYIVGVIRDTIELFVRLEEHLAPLQELTDIAKYLREFQNPTSSTSLVHKLKQVDAHIPKTIEILNTAKSDIDRTLDLMEKPRQIMAGLREKVTEFDGSLPMVLKPFEPMIRNLFDQIIYTADLLDENYVYLSNLSEQMQQDIDTLRSIHEVVVAAENEDIAQNSHKWPLIAMTLLISWLVGISIGHIMGNI